MTKTEIVERFSTLMNENIDNYSICNFVTNRFGTDQLFSRLNNIGIKPLTKVQFDQLLHLHNIKGVTDGFFKFYWLKKTSEDHFYKEQNVDIDFDTKGIASIDQLYFGFERLFIDCLFTYGNIERGFSYLSELNEDELKTFFKKFRFDTEAISQRGNTLPFNLIKKEDRYLISEMACKTLEKPEDENEFTQMIINAYKNATKMGKKQVKFQDLLEGKYNNEPTEEQMQMSLFAYNDILEETIDSEDKLKEKARQLSLRFLDAHKKATENTKLYLSLCRDLDVYVATSMRTKKDFIDMADFCENVFKDEKLVRKDLRYFDPTMSAADTHEDKGLIECLMVKSARMLIYSAGLKDSYGKDAEAAMALSLGKPTIFYCKEQGGKAAFFRDVHPLSRLINFQTGVACGVIVCQEVKEVVEIISRLFGNTMEYKIEQEKESKGFYRLKDKYTGSVVRVQTDNALLTSAFWNNYIRSQV